MTFNNLSRQYEIRRFESWRSESRQFESKKFDIHQFESWQFESRQFESQQFDIQQFESWQYDIQQFESKKFDIHQLESRQYDIQLFDIRQYDIQQFESRQYDIRLFDIRHFESRQRNVVVAASLRVPAQTCLPNSQENPALSNNLIGMSTTGCHILNSSIKMYNALTLSFLPSFPQRIFKN
jgi:hypothetical protein